MVTHGGRLLRERVNVASEDGVGSNNGLITAESEAPRGGYSYPQCRGKADKSS